MASSSPGRSGWPVTGLRIALLTVAYAAAGVPALHLAIPPGYAAPIFPPAGIMLAAGLIYGYAALPAAFFGSLLMREIAFGGFPGGPVSLQWGGLAISAASMLHAVIGTRLIRALCGPAPALDTPATIGRFVLLCLLAALVSATVSIPALLAGGIEARGNAL